MEPHTSPQNSVPPTSLEPVDGASLATLSYYPQTDTPAQSQCREAIINAIKTVFDPEIPVNIYDLGLIYEIGLSSAKNAAGETAIETQDAYIKMTLTAPNCPVAGEMPGRVQAAAETAAGIAEVKVDLVFDPAWEPSRMSDAARLELGMM